GPVEAGDEAQSDWISAGPEDDWNCRGCRLGRHCPWSAAGRRDHGHLTCNQISRHRRQSVIVALRPTIFDQDILTFDVAEFTEPFAERGDVVSIRVGPCATQQADHRHRWLLRARRERPRSRRAAEQRDELAARHSITSSARPSRVGGTVTPRAFAVFWLITSSILVAC